MGKEGVQPDTNYVKGEGCKLNVTLISNGFWVDNKVTFNVFDYDLPRLLVQLGVIIFITQSLHLLLRRFRVPRLVPEILAGIILGPTALGRIAFVREEMFPKSGEAYLDMLSKLGYILFIFLCGVKMEPRTLLRTGTKPWLIGLTTVIVPAVGGLLMTRFVLRKVQSYRAPAYNSFLLIQNLNSFPVVATMLEQLNIFSTELGRLALASSLITDTVGNTIFTAVSHGRISLIGFAGAMTFQSILLSLSLIAVIVLVGKPVSIWIIKHTPEGEAVRKHYVMNLAVMVLVLSILTDNAGLHYIYGPFILGLVIPTGPPLGTTLVDKLQTLVAGILTPLLVTFCAMHANLVNMYDLGFLHFILLGISSSLCIKLGTTMISSFASGLPWKDALALAIIMSSQGIVHMAFYYEEVVTQTIDSPTFSIMILSVMIQTMIGHLATRYLYKSSRQYAGYQKRDIQHAPLNAEFRMLTCAHRLDDVLSITKILETCFSTVEKPLAIYALHFAELYGAAHPQLIDHQLGQKTSEENNRTQKMVEAISSFQQEYAGFVRVEQYTAMTQTKFMHHDICTLAFNKLVSLIILPFHRRWDYQGKLVKDDEDIRAINHEVIENAPCSVAVFINRQKVLPRPPSPTYNIGVPFFGGNDDREALAFATRMARSRGVRLIVVRFLAYTMAWRESKWDAVLDAEKLKELRMVDAERDNVVYKEEKVKDGAESAFIIHEMEDMCDLLIVGMHHREEMPQLSGLSEWNDFPELGPIGDVLAASDISKPVSVLVVQQQKVLGK